MMRRNGLGQGENGIIFSLDMSGEMHMRRRSEVFGCIPHGRGAFRKHENLSMGATLMDVSVDCKLESGD